MLYRVPAHISDEEGHFALSLVNIRFEKDGSFNLESADDQAIPFENGELLNRKLIETTIQAHYETAKTVKKVASFFGVDVNKIAKKRLKKRNKTRIALDLLEAHLAEMRKKHTQKKYITLTIYQQYVAGTRQQ